MIYVVTKQHIKPRQISWETVIEDKVIFNDLVNDKSNSAGTITKKYEKADEGLLEKIDVDEMIGWLKSFNTANVKLFETDRKSLYNSFKIPKATGGFRQIDAPCEELQSALRQLANFLTDVCGILYHTSAFAYIKNRCIVDCVKKHQRNKSNWFLKIDFSGFFPSTTINFVMQMYSMIFPLSEVCKVKEGYEALKKALSLGFLNGGLPQGTCLSPVTINQMMIPIDFKLFNELAKRKIVYTRYADDIHISAVEMFPYKEIIQLVRDTLKEFEAPFTIKDEKTHFGKRAGRSGNWMLGLMYNKDDKIGVGWKKKERFRAALTSFVLDTKNQKYWCMDDVQHLRGLLSYYTMVEPEYFKGVIDKCNKKWNVDVGIMFKNYMNGTI